MTQTIHKEIIDQVLVQICGNQETYLDSLGSHNPVFKSFVNRLIGRFVLLCDKNGTNLENTKQMFILIIFVPFTVTARS